jgi:hypothetical protein
LLDTLIVFTPGLSSGIRDRPRPHHPKNPLDPKGIEERARKKQS